jgi:pSer/pThr/pTyr-binding forkhead associated (FHA) protein
MAPETADPGNEAATSGSVDLELEVVAGDANGETITVADELVIGRHAPGLGMVANDVELSREHSRIVRGEDGAYTIEDLGSTNGTFVNGSRVESVQALALGDTIEVGTAGLLVKSLPTPPTPPGQETSVRGVAPVALPVLDLRLRVDFEAREVHLSSDGEPAVRLAFDSGRWRIEAEG